MGSQEIERKFWNLYRKADYNTRKKMRLEIHRILTRNKSKKQRTRALFCAAKDGNQGAVKTILMEGDIDVNVQDKLGNTPLIYATLNGFRDIVKLLLDAGANPMIENNRGHNSLSAANQSKDPVTIELLLN